MISKWEWMRELSTRPADHSSNECECNCMASSSCIGLQFELWCCNFSRTWTAQDLVQWTWMKKERWWWLCQLRVHPWERVRRLKFWNAENFWSLLLMQVFRNGYWRGQRQCHGLHLFHCCKLVSVMPYLTTFKCLLMDFAGWMNCVKRDANAVAHSLARYARLYPRICFGWRTLLHQLGKHCTMISYLFIKLELSLFKKKKTLIDFDWSLKWVIKIK